MQTIRAASRAAILAGALLFLLQDAPDAHAQAGGAYSLSWNTLSSGIGSVAGGPYQVRGSVGQPDAGQLSAGAYTVHGGFWLPGAQGTVSIPITSDPIPIAFSAPTPAPNPFRVSTMVAFELPDHRRVKVAIFGLDGRRVRVLLDEERQVGRHRVAWNGRDDHGHLVAAGVYFAHIVAGEFSASHRVVRLD
jgi:hypothetical protein